MDSRHSTQTDLIFEPVEIAALWSIQGNRESSLSNFETALFDASAGIGSMLHSPALRWLRLWPHQAYLLADNQPVPASVPEFESLMTDISDGYCEFRLSGEQAFDFLANYLTADLAKSDSGSACLRCRLGHYVVILWWEDRHQLQLLIERSYAQSFADYIESLMARWRPETP
jgi:sarcosine oxidase gamma subunit